MIGSKFESICNLFHAREANSDKIDFLAKAPLSRSRSIRTLLPRSKKFCHEKLRVLVVTCTVKISSF